MSRDNVFSESQQPQWWSSRREEEDDVPLREAEPEPTADPEEQPDGIARTPMQRLYLRVWNRIDSEAPPEKSSGGGYWPLITLVLFVVALTGQVDLTVVYLLAGVVLFHELGHYCMMRLFGYSDVRIFFIPLFGGAAIGKKYAAPGWQQAIVLLAGPLPGILVAMGVLLIRGWNENDPVWLHEAVGMLLMINGFNLLPVLPLDGGRLLALLIFNRHPMLEMLFRLFTTLAGGLFAFYARSWFFGLITLQMMTSMGSTYRQALARRRLKQDFPKMPASLADTDEHLRWALMEEARHVWRSIPDDRIDDNANVTVLTNTVRQLHEGSVTRAPGLLLTPLLLGVYGFFVLAVPTAGMFIGLSMESAQYKARVEENLDAWTNELDRLDNKLEFLAQRIENFREDRNPAVNMEFSANVDEQLGDVEADLVALQNEILAAEIEANDDLRLMFESSPDQREQMSGLHARAGKLIERVEDLRVALTAPDANDQAVEGEVAWR